MANTPITKDYLEAQLRAFKQQVISKDYVEKHAILPTATSDMVGKIVQYVGTTIAGTGPINGFFYICQPSTTSPGSYEWTEKKVQKTEESGANVIVKKLDTPETGYFASYQLYDKDSDTPISDSDPINIPKDFLVKSADIKQVTQYAVETGYDENDLIINDETLYRVEMAIEASANTAFSDLTVTDLSPMVASESDKFIDFVINVKSGTDEANEHLYLAVFDLAAAYTGGNGISIESSTNNISVDLDTNSGLAFGGTDNDKLKVKVQNTTDINLSIDANGIKAEMVYETTPIDWSDF